MAMSRKDYVKFAALLAGELALAKSHSNREAEIASVETVRNTTFSMADIFAADNPNFDRARFYAAAGL